MKITDNERIVNGWKALSRGYFRLTACIIFGVGLVILLTALDDEPLLRQQDILTGLSTRVVLLISGIMYAGIGTYLFVGRGLMTRGLLVSWLCLSLIVYRIGMNWMSASHPSPAVILTGWKAGIWPRILDRYFVAWIIYLALGGLLVVVMEWKAGRVQTRNASSQAERS